MAATPATDRHRMHITVALPDAPRLPIGISTDTKAGHFEFALAAMASYTRHTHACSRAPMSHQHAHAWPMQLQLQLGHRGPWVPRAWLPWNKNKTQPSEQRELGPGFVCSLEHLLLLLFKTVHKRGFAGSTPSTTCMCEACVKTRSIAWRGVVEGGGLGGTPK